MSKGFWSLSDFDITCKKCGGDNISVEETDGYIMLTCDDCEEKKEEEEFENEYGKVPEFIKRLLKKDTKAFKELFTQNEQILEVLKEVQIVLDDDYEKGLKEGYDGGSLDKNTSSAELVTKITELYDKIRGMYLINNIYSSETYKSYFNLDLNLIKDVGFKENGWGIVNVTNYSFIFEDNQMKFENYKPIKDYESDTLVMGGEVESHIEILGKDISDSKDVFTKYNLL